MPEDAQLKKPPDKHTVKKQDTIEPIEPIVLPFGPKVQTVETNSQNRGEESKVFIQDKSTAIPGSMKDYRYLTYGEHTVKMKEEDNKGIDPCEEGMECMQDKEIRKKAKAIEELNWKHKDEIPEANGPTISPDRNWNPGRPQDEEQINEHIRLRTQDPKLRAQEKELEKEQEKETYEQMKQMQL